jgi:hypothetical protein
MMALYWLCYRHGNQISVVIEPAASLIHAGAPRPGEGTGGHGSAARPVAVWLRIYEALPVDRGWHVFAYHHT